MVATYNEKPVAKWSTNDFIAYLCDRHLAVYGTEYTPPGRNWQVERGLIGTLIGTKGKNAKPRKYEPEVVKAFIDECFRIHRCTPQWPTVSFTWFWKWKTDVWARVVASEMRRQAVVRAEVENEAIDDWL
jgi:hypothetical protein